MRQIVSTLITLLWALWFGGVLTLFLAVTAIFAEFPQRHDLAGQAANHVFKVFNVYQLGLAASSLIAVFVWYVLGPPKIKMALFSLLGVATVAACLIAMYLAPHLTELQKQGMAQSAEFKRLHGYSMWAYLAEAVALLAAGVFIAVMRDSPRTVALEPQA